MTFEEYLVSKKIDKQQFEQQEPGRYASWKAEFEQLHPESFTTQKKFLINEVRRKYLAR
ncbi:hypothetical protein LX87_04946 [Larkinella arboricola]|uniref:Uncharacterized protein n=1 Tax=Larkinella arboricola TaxID=643671 RepID=A0A327WUN5_LARAB|nr:hypothetical protein [Larkinella arboricola]RAJ92616.1 hypothetical protein LX87_04946 [Larkinella arboricola]